MNHACLCHIPRPNPSLNPKESQNTWFNSQLCYFASTHSDMPQLHLIYIYS
jgi:hypothetical protein